ncbi:MAG: hypothetical protein MMC33_008077 [Icmadophila ericetorum]|nr:hypothetical protein [Icmadophila ericetorum]
MLPPLFVALWLLRSLLLTSAPTSASATTALAAAPKYTYFNLTAIAAKDGASVLQCWQLANPFMVSSTPGTAGTAIETLGNAANASYTILPARFDGGLHHAPAVQYVAFLSGLVRIYLPNNTEVAYVHGGKKGLILAVDTPDVSQYGHYSDYPSGEQTVAMQIPTAGGVVPEHRVLYEGGCKESELDL